MSDSVSEREMFLWVEQYRPKTIEECILPKRIKERFKSFVADKNIPNLLLSGSPGTGKTTVARALCEELGYDCLVINASDERNIDVVRGRIRDFASTASMFGNKKAIILDEADGLNPATTQPALRAAIEEFHTVRFILTCNYKNRLIPALQSRAMGVEFSVKPEEQKEVQINLLQRVLEILKIENIEFDAKVVAQVVKTYFPDNRKILNMLQGYSAGGVIDTGILTTLRAANTGPLVLAMRDNDIGKVKQWVVDNSDMDMAIIFRALYDTLYTELVPDVVPQMILVIAQYQYYSSFVADQEINLVAMLLEILSFARWN